MSRNRLRFVTTCGLAVGLFFVGQGGRAEERNSAPGKVAGAAGAVADQQKPATFLRAMGVSPAANYEKSGPSPAGPGAAGGRPAAGAAPSAEPLMVLKSGPEHKRLVYHVKAVPVSDLERTVSQLFHLEGELHPLGGATGTGASASRVAIAASKTGNSLVVSGPPDAVEEVWTLLEKLDQLHGLVLLEMEIGEAPVGETKPAGTPVPGRGPSDAATAGTYRLLARPAKMETTGRVRLVATDNQPAFVQMGSRVPRITNTAKGQANTTVLENVGLILGVTPRITPDGTIVMELDAEQSQLGPENEGIPISVAGDKVIRTPRIDTAMVQTTVTIPDGQTIILGSVPQHGKSNKELLIIVTPHIIRAEDAKPAR